MITNLLYTTTQDQKFNSCFISILARRIPNADFVYVESSLFYVQEESKDNSKVKQEQSRSRRKGKGEGTRTKDRDVSLGSVEDQVAS